MLKLPVYQQSCVTRRISQLVTSVPVCGIATPAERTPKPAPPGTIKAPTPDRSAVGKRHKNSMNYLTSRLGPDKHHQLPPFHSRLLEDNTIITQFIRYIVDGIKANRLGIDYFTATKPHGYLDFIVLIEKFSDLFDLEIQIMLFSLRPEFDFLCLDGCLLFFRFLLLLLQLIAIFIKIHQTTDRRICLAGDFDQIQSPIISHALGLSGGKHSYLFTIFANKPNLGIGNGLIGFYANFLFLRFVSSPTFDVSSSWI